MDRAGHRPPRGPERPARLREGGGGARPVEAGRRPPRRGLGATPALLLLLNVLLTQSTAGGGYEGRRRIRRRDAPNPYQSGVEWKVVIVLCTGGGEDAREMENGGRSCPRVNSKYFIAKLTKACCYPLSQKFYRKHAIIN